MTKTWSLVLILTAVASLQLAARAEEPAKSSERQAIEKSLFTAADKIKGVEIRKNKNGVVITLRKLFKTGEVVFTPEGQLVLKSVARMIEMHPGLEIEIGGHTDSMGSSGHNQRIAEKRAEAIKFFMLKKMNIKPGRMKAIGYGEARPIASNRTKAGRDTNRRIEIIFKIK
ncbi:MAG: OmpA family protein [Deltaproteobacteria bacterium]|nr:OmpA family protein [Deltaproteobacteria bacterium]